jgi:hypothetical protein
LNSKKRWRWYVSRDCHIDEGITIPIPA